MKSTKFDLLVKEVDKVDDSSFSICENTTSLGKINQFLFFLNKYFKYANLLPVFIQSEPT